MLHHLSLYLPSFIMLSLTCKEDPPKTLPSINENEDPPH
jgi:hypothetical protein